VCLQETGIHTGRVCAITANEQNPLARASDIRYHVGDASIEHADIGGNIATQ
jgi:DNA-binding MurR/RpiR family transcriptional regulator